MSRKKTDTPTTSFEDLLKGAGSQEYSIFKDSQLSELGLKIAQDKTLQARVNAYFMSIIAEEVECPTPEQGLENLRNKMSAIRKWLQLSTFAWLRGKNDRKAATVINALENYWGMTRVLIKEVEGIVEGDYTKSHLLATAQQSKNLTKVIADLEQANQIMTQQFGQEYADEPITTPNEIQQARDELNQLSKTTLKDTAAIPLETFITRGFQDKQDLVETLILFIEQEVNPELYTVANVAWTEQDVAERKTIVIHTTGTQVPTSAAPPRVGTELGQEMSSGRIEELLEEIIRRQDEGS